MVGVSADRLSSLDSYSGLNINTSLSGTPHLVTFKPTLPQISKHSHKCYTESQISKRETAENNRHSTLEKGPTYLIEKVSTGRQSDMNRHLPNKCWRGYNQYSNAFISRADEGSRFSHYRDEVSVQNDEEYYSVAGEPEFLVLNAKSYAESTPELGMVTSTPSFQRSYTKMTTEDSRNIEQVYGGYNSRLPHKLGSFEQARDSGVYKRTRQVLSERPLRQWPAGLELSGRSVMDDDLQIKELKDSEEVPGITDEPPVGGRNTPNSISSRLPPLSDSPRTQPKVHFSSSYYTDYGLKPQRTDLFSGYKRQRKAKSASEVELEKELEAKAKRHIYACQVLSSVKRASKTAHNVSLLRKTLDPRKASSNLSFFRPARPSTDTSSKSLHMLDASKRGPVAFFIKTRENSTVSRSKIHKSEALPEISGRTVIYGVSGK